MVIEFYKIKQLKLIDKITKELEEVKNMNKEELDEVYRDYYKNY